MSNKQHQLASVEGVTVPIPGELMVEFIEDLPEEDQRAILAAVDGSIKQAGKYKTLVTIPEGTEEEAITELQQKEGVISVQQHTQRKLRRPVSPDKLARGENS